MATLELNLAAKPVYTKLAVNQRRADMRAWRKHQTMMFTDKAAFNKWLDYTKWHKRPILLKDTWGGMVSATFLDWKPKK